MSQSQDQMSQERVAGPATAVEDAGNGSADGQDLRFTPLRSYAKRARTLTKDARSELALSRLEPIARL